MATGKKVEIVRIEVDGQTVDAKACGNCGEVKALAEFYKGKEAGGRQTWCKACKAEYRREQYNNNRDTELERNRQYYANNREVVLERQRQYNTNNREVVIERQRDRYATNREAECERSRQYHEANREAILERQRQYNVENRELFKAREHKRRAFQRSLPAEKLDLTLPEYAVCALTGTTDNIHVDHVIPLSWRHGGTVRENMVPLSGTLNRSKKDKHLFHWFDSVKERYDLSQDRFDAMVAHLAELNNLTVDEYREYYDWCHENQRTAKQIKRDGIGMTSLELWKRARA